MMRRLDHLWHGLLRKAHLWIVCRANAYRRREARRGSKAHWRRQAMCRLEQHVASQKPHLN